MTWMSKGPSPEAAHATSKLRREGTTAKGKAHYVASDGEALCVEATQLDGVTPILAPFKCSWVPLRDFDKKCTYCRRIIQRRKGEAL